MWKIKCLVYWVPSAVSQDMINLCLLASSLYKCCTSGTFCCWHFWLWQTTVLRTCVICTFLLGLVMYLHNWVWCNLKIQDLCTSVIQLYDRSTTIGTYMKVRNFYVSVAVHPSWTLTLCQNMLGMSAVYFSIMIYMLREIFTIHLKTLYQKF